MMTSGAGEKAQQVKAFAAKPEDLDFASWDPHCRIRDATKLSSDLHTSAVEHTHTCKSFCKMNTFELLTSHFYHRHFHFHLVFLATPRSSEAVNWSVYQLCL